ncbi:4-azaleucine resistance probable transporter AzlC [Desulfatibacillum alkenivorans DSM 16219]|jgi:4-azaleucine resistance transporter AzlC|uniref:4-azaleucine resistance probable transporter AzlC n=1 Tax=Desulfatibacillum alkenivorans DSM 16219 TaxID=1121393 RepID=A0A1M6Y1W9_9BACT|nr:AzlC family ABC transporter permease [Desulfatibacillum alkenivorans]SHL12251.1 4-azaleucine resistance probable transporter AzlC [Desulfatibacillum alkenivorans DSM 16219]
MDAEYQDKEKDFLKQGLVAAWPICMGYMPIGMALGVLAQKAGLSVFEMALMSVIVFAGSAQFICVSMLVSGAASIPIIITTFVVNLRHVLLSSSLAKHLDSMSLKGLALYAYGVTDESFGVNYTRFIEGGWSPKKALVVNHASNLCWILCTIAGAWFGELIPQGAFGIDYALIAMFIGLLIFQIRGLIYVASAVIAGLAASVMHLYTEGNMYVIVGAMTGATVCLALRRTAFFKRFEKAREEKP